MDDAVRALARKAGIANDWTDANGVPRRVAIGSLRSILAALGFPCQSKDDIAESGARLRELSNGARSFLTATKGKPVRLHGDRLDSRTAAELLLEDGSVKQIKLRAVRGGLTTPAIDQPGYHRLRFSDKEITLAVAPPRCVTLEDVAPGEKLYGVAVQLYSLRRANDGGIGDTTALHDLVAGAARQRADAVALSPVHSLFAADPAHYGPYSPSSRLFLNPLYADPAMLFGTARVAAAAGHEQLEQGSLIDWPGAARAKYALLRRLFDDFGASDLVRKTALASDFEDFVREGGERLHEHALFEALHGHWFGAPEPKWNWREWPEDWRTPQGAAVIRFADTEARAIQFHMFTQWIATRSFSAVQQAARDAGMRIGLIADLAIGMHPGGSHAWSRQQDLLLDLSVGAPPDLFNMRGQDWGLTGFSPQALIGSGFEPFLATLRAAMRYAGGVRIDHVMGLGRLWLVPRGASPTDGAYLAYPLDDLLRLLAIESHRHRAIVIGEDLGTVEPAFRKRLSRAGVAGMDVLWFQRRGQSFLAPGEWRRDAVAMTTTHDLPTVAGWWKGVDIATRDTLGLVADRKREEEERAKDRSALWRAVRKAGVVAADEADSKNEALAVDAAVAFAAQSPAPLGLIPIEDILGLTEQPNVPGTIDEHPNWRRRLDAPASEILNAPQARARLASLRGRRA